MKKSAFSIALLFAALVLTNSLIAQSNPPTLKWAHSFGSGVGNFEGAQRMAIDLSGNMYSLGMFDSTFDFDPGPGVFNLTSNGQLDFFIQKLDANGNFVWAKSVGSAAYDIPGNIWIDGSANVFVTGIVYDTTDFDPGTGTTSLPANNDAFVLKLDVNGNFVWAKTTQGSGYAYGASVTTDVTGNVYVSGEFNGDSDFDPSAGTSNFTSAGNSDAFLLKLDATGNFDWVKVIASDSYDAMATVRTDAAGSVYGAGYFSDTTDINPDAGVQTEISAGSFDAFILKIDAAGNFVWAKPFGGAGEEQILSVTIDLNGDVYAGGHFYGTTDLDPGAATVNATAVGTRDIFIDKFDPNGNYLWSWYTGGPNYEAMLELCTDASGNVYSIAQFKGTIDVDPGPGTTFITGNANGATLLTKMSTGGTMVWSEAFNADFQSIGRSIAVDANYDIYMLGDFRDTTDIAPGPGMYNLGTNGDYDIFTAKFSQCNTWSFSNQTSCDSFVWMGNTYTTSGTYSDTLLNTAGCDSVQYLALSISNNDTSVSVSGVTLTANENGATYQWLDCDNAYAIISGENAQAFTPASNGNFAVAITKNGCTDTSSCYSITTTGIGKNNVAEVLIYPNPSNGSFTIKTKTPGKYRIVNSIGQVVKTVELNAENNFVGVTNLSNGIYFLITDDVKMAKQKIVVSGN